MWRTNQTTNYLMTTDQGPLTHFLDKVHNIVNTDWIHVDVGPETISVSMVTRITSANATHEPDIGYECAHDLEERADVVQRHELDINIIITLYEMEKDLLQGLELGCVLQNQVDDVLVSHFVYCGQKTQNYKLHMA